MHPWIGQQNDSIDYSIKYVVHFLRHVESIQENISSTFSTTRRKPTGEFYFYRGDTSVSSGKVQKRRA
jgi:hypothetical protein